MIQKLMNTNLNICDDDDDVKVMMTLPRNTKFDKNCNDELKSCMFLTVY